LRIFPDFQVSLNPESPHMMSGREEQIEDRWAAVVSSILRKWEKCPAGSLQSNLPGFKPAVSQDNDRYGGVIMQSVSDHAEWVIMQSVRID